MKYRVQSYSTLVLRKVALQTPSLGASISTHRTIEPRPSNLLLVILSLNRGILRVITMSSDRPRTPHRSSFGVQAESAESERNTDSKATATDSLYIPRVSDLVTPARDAINLSDKSIPPVYLEAEAVDSSILLGHGASFTASLRYVFRGT